MLRSTSECIAAAPPEPLAPVPSKEQMRWQKQKLLIFNHFVTKELADACHEQNMWFGLYFSAYDLNYQNSSCDKDAYPEFCAAQLIPLFRPSDGILSLRSLQLELLVNFRTFQSS